MFKTFSQAIENLPELFSIAKKIYNQDRGDFYQSDEKSINGLHMAVLPERDEYLFTAYSIGDQEDLIELRKLYNYGIFKTYDCTLCAISRPDNTLLLSDEQNQLVIKKDSPSTLINLNFQGPSGKKYLISGTVPQYYYNHLLYSSSDHLPTYSVFYDKFLFNDLMEYLKFSSLNISNLYAFFNGNFGSDIYHFHVHLTNQKNTILSNISSKYINDGIFSYEEGIVKLLVFTYLDLDLLYKKLSDEFASILILRNTKPNYVITANFFYKNNRYYVTIQVVNRNKNKWEYKKCNYIVFPASFILVASCFNPPTNNQELNDFVSNMRDNLKDLYINPADYISNRMEIEENIIPGNEYLKLQNKIQNTDFYNIINDDNIENFYIWMEYRRINNMISYDMINYLLNILLSSCYSINCTKLDKAKFNYILGIVFNIIDYSIIDTPQIREFRISAEFYRLSTINRQDNINIPGNINTDYMFFRGKFIQYFLKKTINNLLIITRNNSDFSEETSEITKWLKHSFKRIGEASASGVNSIVEVNFPNIDMVMKMMNMYSVDINDNYVYNNNKPKEFIHEFYTGMIVNDIRNYIPNFIITYGGFFCNSSSPEKLCDNGPGKNYSYLLIETIKNSDTIGRYIKTPMLSYKEQINDMIDIISQVLTGLAFGWNLNHFTHYDLHVNNIMLYDFIENKNFMKLFKIYNEYNGDIVPEIRNVIFRYYMSKNNKKDVILIPAKYLSLIIDYGSAYVDGMPQGSQFYYENRYQNLGMTSDKSNIVFDTYTFMMSLFLNILMHKPYLLISDDRWIDNFLVNLFHMTIKNYGELWVKNYNDILNDILTINKGVDKSSRYRMYKNLFEDNIKPKYKINHPQYLHFSFPVDSVPVDFRGANAVIKYINNNHYSKMNLENKLTDKYTYVFNWGYTTDRQENEGIQPNEDIKNMIKHKIQYKSQSASTMKNFMSGIENREPKSSIII